MIVRLSGSVELLRGPLIVLCYLDSQHHCNSRQGQRCAIFFRADSDLPPTVRIPARKLAVDRNTDVRDPQTSPPIHKSPPIHSIPLHLTAPQNPSPRYTHTATLHHIPVSKPSKKLHGTFAQGCENGCGAASAAVSQFPGG